MVKRVFLGWKQPFVGLAAEWLLNHREALSSSLVIVPTAQSGRQLKHTMASRTGAILSPKFSTPGALMRTEDSSVAPDWLESLAWQEVLENETARKTLENLFSESAQTSGEWAGGLAGEMVALRRDLQENGLKLRDVARRLSSTPESARWDALSSIETLVDKWLSKHNYQSRSEALQGGALLPEGLDHIILAGVSELTPLVKRTLEESGITLTALIAAPEELKSLFTELGTPTEEWNQQSLDWPGSHGSVEILVDPKHQAAKARALAADSGTHCEELAIGTADSESGDLIAHEFTQAGWPSFHPASFIPGGGLRRWLHCWSEWLLQADLKAMMNLLYLPQSSSLIETDCASIADSLAKLRDRWMVIQPEDLRHQLRHHDHRRLKGEAVEVLRACEKLEKWREFCLKGKTADALKHLLDALGSEEGETESIMIWIDEAGNQMNESKRSMSFWIELMLSNLPRPQATPPADRILDIHGWLELLFQPGRHLILCGLNEGKIPATGSEDPWLGESGRALLELPTNQQRAARDAFLMQSMIRSRVESSGRVDLLCTRINGRGEPQLPSRLLLAARPDQTAERVEILFRELEPVDAKLRWQVEDAARWKPPTGEIPIALNATSFRDYLACPFRYYLKHVHRMHASEPDRIEWNARDFGNIIHNVLEKWGRDEQARNLSSADEIREWLNLCLDEEVQSIFNHRIPLAVRIQLDAIRQRLAWFSEIQEELIQQGWRVAEVEHQFEIPVGNITVRAKIDRIDHHLESGEIRIIDYKTGGKSSSTSSAHRTRQIASSRLPEHINEEDPALYTSDDGKKETTYMWKDLQLPLYALAIHRRDKQLATPCYFKLGETRNDVALDPWQDFDEADLDAAESCASWVSDRIANKRFSPISQNVTYDDYDLLWCSHSSEEVITESGF